MAASQFYAATLSSQNDNFQWKPENLDDQDYPRAQRLVIKQILLGSQAKDSEFNVVEVTSDKDSVKIPIAILKAGETRAVNPDVEFYETAVIFKLIVGSGPVYVHGQIHQDEIEPTEWENESEEEDEECLEYDEEELQSIKKQRITKNGNDETCKPKRK